jgi:hypothetical protein
VSPAGGGATPTPSGAPVTSASIATQRNFSASALSAVGNGVDFDELSSPAGVSTFALERAKEIAHTRTTASGTPSCQNGVEFSQTSTGSGQVMQTIEFFYDSACTEPYKLLTRTITFTSTGGTAQGTEEDWDQSGNVVAYKTDSITFAFGLGHGGIGSIVDQRTIATAPGAPPFAQTGESCVLGGTNQIDCGAGNVLAISEPSASPSPISESIGFQGLVTGKFVTAAPSASPSPSASESTDAQGPGNWGAPNELQLQFNGAGYTGALGALTLAPAATPPAWTISGGQQILTLTGSGTLAFGGFGGHNSHGGWQGGDGAMSSLSLTLDDAADGLTIALTSSGNKLTGSVQNSKGQTVATISLDYSGTGTITYTSGALSIVKDWIILS